GTHESHVPFLDEVEEVEVAMVFEGYLNHEPEIREDHLLSCRLVAVHAYPDRHFPFFFPCHEGMLRYLMKVRSEGIATFRFRFGLGRAWVFRVRELHGVPPWADNRT